MPEYEFVCHECGARTDVLAPYAVAADLELVCVTCGGTMAKGITRTFAISISRGGAREVDSDGRAAKKHDHHHHHDTHGAVKLTRPNPFRSEISHGGEG